MSAPGSNKTVIAFDPGKVTGYAARRNTGQLECGQITPYFGPDGVRVLLAKWMPDMVIVEQFQGPVRSHFFDATPLEVIGVVKDWVYLPHRAPMVRLIFQMASSVKHYFTNERLKKEGLYQAGQPHAMDALRHLLYQETFGKPAP